MSMSSDVTNPLLNPPLKARVEAYERELILRALEASGWNQRRAAESLGLLPTTLFEKMRRLQIPHARERAHLAITGARILSS